AHRQLLLVHQPVARRVLLAPPGAEPRHDDLAREPRVAPDVHAALRSDSARRAGGARRVGAPARTGCAAGIVGPAARAPRQPVAGACRLGIDAGAGPAVLRAVARRGGGRTRWRTGASGCGARLRAVRAALSVRRAAAALGLGAAARVAASLRHG